MVWNAISVLIVMGMSSYFGRRTLMLWSEGLIALCMIAMWILKMEGDETMALIATAFFIFLFEVMFNFQVIFFIVFLFDLIDKVIQHT